MARKRIGSIVFSAAALAAGAAAQTPLTPAFTYQGQLKEAGQPADGLYDFIFDMMDAASDGNYIGGTMMVRDVPVTEGLFTVLLNNYGQYGPAAFNGQARWLQIHVKRQGTSAYETLSPRQPLTAVPYALAVPGIDGHSLNASDDSPLDALFVNADGYVGIGTATPAHRLSVATPASDFGFSQTDGTRDITSFVGPYGNADGGWIGTRSNFPLHFYTADSDARMTLGTDGFVGIGTTNPTSPLSFRNADERKITFWESEAPNGFYGIDMAAGGRVRHWGGMIGSLEFGHADAGGAFVENMRINSAGHVGVNTTNPRSRLQVGLTTISDSWPWAGFGQNYWIANNQFGRIDESQAGVILSMNASSPSGRWFRFERIEPNGSNGLGEVAVIGRPNTYFMSDRVGILDNTPEYTLDVNGTTGTLGLHVSYGSELRGTTRTDTIICEGDVSVDGMIYAPDAWISGRTTTGVLQITGGSDIAEPFDVDRASEVLPGHVMCIDPDNPGKLRPSTKAYDTTVAGVVSGAGGVNPGLTLQQDGSIADGKHPVALTGRVYCYVDADANGAIKPGDLLTTSDTPGHAMKADSGHASGAVLGKAMTALEGGRGLVLVLVSLQ